MVSVTSEISARVLFSIAKFRGNETPAKWQNHSLIVLNLTTQKKSLNFVCEKNSYNFFLILQYYVSIKRPCHTVRFSQLMLTNEKYIQYAGIR